MSLTRLLNLPQRGQEIIAMALFIALLLLAALIVTQSMFTLADQDESLLALRENAAKLTRLASLKDSIKAQPINVGDGDGLLLVAQSVSIARADLQSRITAIAQSHAAAVASIGDVPDLPEKGLILIGVRAVISGTNDSIQKTLLEMATVRPPLLVREFVIQASGMDAADRPLELSVQFQVYGAMRSSDVKTDEVSTSTASEPAQ